jgi:hypothetical protein
VTVTLTVTLTVTVIVTVIIGWGTWRTGHAALSHPMSDACDTAVTPTWQASGVEAPGSPLV